MTSREGIPRSREELRATLERLGLHAHKRFGQNFLSDAGVLDRIVARSMAGPSSVVLEVGPGLGTLTDKLLSAGATVVAVELDHGLARHLGTVFQGAQNLVLIQGDVMARKGHLAEDVVSALRRTLAERPGRRLEVVSNLPYGISSSFLASLVFDPGPPARSTVMLQSEVASVLTARPSTESYSSLSVFAGVFFEVRREFDVGRHAFFPQPDVDSTIVSLVPKSGARPAPERFGRFVQTLFQGRRKALSTTVRNVLPAETGVPARAWLANLGFDPAARIEAMEPGRIVDLFLRVEEARGESSSDDTLRG